MEARLVKGEMEMQTAEPGTGRASLEALQKDANKEGFQLIARKVSAALETSQNQATRGAREPKDRRGSHICSTALAPRRLRLRRLACQEGAFSCGNVSL